MTTKVAVYVRVSTLNQVQDQTIEQQLQRLQDHIAAQGWQLQDEHIFRDDGYSGATLNRPGLDHLRDAMRWGDVTHLLITDPDRLARKYVHQMVLLEEFARLGCQVEFLDRPMSDDPHDQLLLQIRGAVAEYERTLITDRMRRGRLAKYQAGTLLPWTRPPYGYRLDPDRPRDPAGVWIEESEAAVVREIFALYTQESHSLQGLATYLQKQGIPTPSGKQIWSISTLSAMLRQPAYLGQVYARRNRYRPARIRRSATHPMGQPHQTAEVLPPDEWIFVATIPALINQEQFDLAQVRLAQNQSFARRNNKSHTYLLRALVSCGQCQSACIARHLKGGQNYYVCSAKSNPIHSRKAEKCSSRFSPAQQLDELVWQDLCEVLMHPESITQALERACGGHWLPQELQARRENLRRGCAHLQQQLDRLTEAYLNSIIPLAEYQRRRGDLEQKVTALNQQEEQLSIQASRHAELTSLVRSIEDFCQRIQIGLQQATFEQKRQLVELLIDRVIVKDGDVEIHYVIPTTLESEQVRFCHLRSDYFTYPDLLRAHDLQIQNQVRIARKVVIAVGRTPLFTPNSSLDAHQTHQTLHALVVYHPFPTPQLLGDAPVAVSRPGSSLPLDRFLELGFTWQLARPVIVAAPRHPKHLARHFDGIFLRKHTDHLPFPLEREVKMFDAFFATSSSIVSRPTICSKSAIRSCSSPRLRSVAKISDARSRNSSRHREKTCGRSRYSRQISALSLTPVSSSSTTRALNSGVNARRSDIVFPPSDRFYLNYRTCPVFGGQFTLEFR